MQWISVAIILHNLIIEIDSIEGDRREWEDSNTGADGGQDNDGPTDEEDKEEDDPTVRKRNQLIGELLWARYQERL